MQSITHQFLEFCRSKPADEAYNYGDTSGCAFAQFARASGHERAEAGGWTWFPEGEGEGRPKEPIPEPIPDALVHYGWTFGALADRLEAALTSAA